MLRSDRIKVYFPKKILCTSIAANGSDFAITGGPVPVTVTGVVPDCPNNGKSRCDHHTISRPHCSQGNYTLTLKAGNDGNVLIDECGIQMPAQNLPFTAVDTVSAAYTYTMVMGCRLDTLHFAHDGAHDVTKWNWTFNNTTTSTTQKTTQWYSMPPVPIP